MKRSSRKKTSRKKYRKSKSRIRSRRVTKSRKRYSGGAVAWRSPPFTQGKTYEVDGKGVGREIWEYKSPVGKYQHIFIRSTGKPIKVYRHGNRWRIGQSGTPVSIVRNTATTLGRRMVKM